MSRKILAFVLLAAALSALFIRLGVWQLRRLDDRRARNSEVAQRLDAPIVAAESVAADVTYQRVRVRGIPDTAREIVLTGRSRSGSPGVYILTPLRRAASDSAVVVVRGWVYSPDAMTADLSRWQEARAEFVGYAHPFPTDTARPRANAAPAAGAGGTPRRVRNLSFDAVQGLLPYPVAPFYVVALDSVTGAGPARLPPPALDEGPHLSYAIQWFAFAAIALGGAAIVVLRGRTRRGSTAA